MNCKLFATHPSRVNTFAFTFIKKNDISKTSEIEKNLTSKKTPNWGNFSSPN